MDSAISKLVRALAILWLGSGWVRAADAAGTGQLLVDLEAADFVTGAGYWPQHSADTGIPGHFIPRGSPTRQSVAGAPAVVFDGDGDAFLGPITTAALHAPGAPHTVEIWAFQGNIRDQESLVSWGRRGGPDATFAGFRYGADPDFGAVARWVATDTGYQTLPAPGRWHHLAFTYDGRQQAVYVDGRLDSMKPVGVLDAHDTLPILLGAELGGNRQPEGKFTHFSGALGKVRIHRGALSAAAILQRFQADAPRFPGLVARPLARPPQHRFSFTAAAGPAPDGTSIGDSIGGLTAVVRGADARFTGSGVRLPGGSSATAAYLDFPNRLVSGQENVTIELWVTQEAALDWSRILSIGTNRSGEITAPGGGFFGSETLTLFGNVGAAPINRFARSEGTLLNGGPDRDPAAYPESELGTRFHQVIVYDRAVAEWRWYRNGVLMEVIPDAEGPLTLDDVNVWLGRSEFSADNNFRGIYHEVRVYNRALEEGEIFGNSQAGPDRLTLVKPMPAAQWIMAAPGRHPFGAAANWSGGCPPGGVGFTATFATTLAGDTGIELDGPVTLGTLNIGARNAGGVFSLVARGDGGLILDSGSAGPASLAQLPRSLTSKLEAPLTLASDTEIANLSDYPMIVGGPLRGVGPLVKTGPGPLVVTGDGGGFHGEARILTGTLALGDNTRSGSLAASRFALAEAGTLAINRRDDCAISPVVDGRGRFLHQGAGRLVLTESALLTDLGFVDAEDGAGTLVSAGRIDGAWAVRTDTGMVLDAHSNTRVSEYLGIGFHNGGHLTIRDGASVNLTGGQGALNVGDAGSGQSVLSLEGGTVFWKEFYVGKNTGTSGVLLQSGGDLTKRDGSGGDARVGGAFDGTHQVWGAWHLGGGTFSTDSNLQIGAYGLGLLEIAGGSAAIKGFLGIGRFQDAQHHQGRGVVDVTAGRLATTTQDRLLLVGEEGIGVLNIRDRGTVVCANQLIIGAGTLASAGTGTVNLLRGGILTTAGISQFNQARASGSLYCDGGELRAGGSNPVFLDGLDSALLGPGGVLINSNGFEITIAQPLLAPAGSGVACIPVIAAGSGYLAPPLIEISGGGGSGATAVAKLVDGGIRELTITNPGSGYTSSPAVSVLGGGSGQGLTLGTPVLRPNRSGGLAKTGSGTLVLTGRSTYSGPTTVRQGELRVGGDLSGVHGSVEVAAGAILSGGGGLGGGVQVGAGATLAPDDPAGALRIGGGLSLGGTLAIRLDGNRCGRVDVAGTLYLGQAKLTVYAGETTAPRQVHIIATYGSLHGRFASCSLPPGFTLDYHHDGRKQLALVPTAPADGN